MTAELFWAALAGALVGSVGMNLLLAFIRTKRSNHN